MQRNDFKFTFEDGSEALAHYGVLGMKWGVRKDYGHSGRLLDGMVNKDTPIVEKNRKFLSENPGAFPKKASQSSPLEDMRAINPYYTAASADYDIKDFVSSYKSPSSNRIKIRTDPQHEEEQKIRSIRDDQFGESLINCASCSVAFDLRRRGYDVYATMGNPVSSIIDINMCYPRADMHWNLDGTELVDDMNSNGCNEPGASGIIIYTWPNTNVGHAIAFNADENGKIHYYDCQTGKEEDELPLHAENFTYMRLDNVEPNLEYINRMGCVAPMPSKNEPKSSKGTIEDATSRIRETANAVKTVQDMKKTLKDGTQSKPVENAVKDALSKASGTLEAAKMKQDIKKMLRGDGR